VIDISVLIEQIQKVFDMSDFNLIMVLPFSGKKDEWPICSGKLLGQG
jgi:hypothetical protein